MEWKTVKISDVGDVYSGGTPSSMKSSYWNGDLPWLSSGETSQRYIYNTERSITEEGVKHSSTRLAQKGSIVMASAGQGHTRGQVSMLCIDTYVNQSVLVIKPDLEKIDPYFLYFNLDSRYDELRQLSDSASTRGSLSGKILKDLPINIPSLVEQHQIAAILSSLDDKIENNNRINRNLEAQAQALFKSWFVDFEPWGGTMPKDWKEGTLGDIISEIESGARPKGGAHTSGVPSVGAEKIERFGIYDFSGEKYVSEEFFDKMKRGHVQDGDVMVYKDGAYTGKSSMALDGFPYKKCAVNEHVFLLRTKESKYQFFLYLTIAQNNVREMIHTLACAKAAQPGLNTSEILSVETLIPSEESIAKFNELVASMMHTIANNSLESARLAQLRDTLLPKLMKGEINI